MQHSRLTHGVAGTSRCLISHRVFRRELSRAEKRTWCLQRILRGVQAVGGSFKPCSKGGSPPSLA